MRARNVFVAALISALLSPLCASAATTELVSVTMGGGPADGETRTGVMTPDGHLVAFASAAGNLVAGDTNVLCDADEDMVLENCPDIFVRDRPTSTTTLVSVDSFGVQGDGESDDPDISADGRWVVFESQASNLVVGDTNAKQDCFLHDRTTGATERVSVTDSEAEAGGAHCRVSDDGRFVVFSSRQDVLTPFHSDAYNDVFVRDRQLGTTQWISFGGSIFAENDCWDGNNDNPSISGDGRFVFFQHNDDLFACDSEARKVIIFDRENFTWEQAPVDTDTLANAGPLDFTRFFTFRLSPGPGLPTRLFLRDRDLGTTEEIGVSSTGVHANANSFGGRVTSDGRFVAFTSLGDNLVPGDTQVCNFPQSCADVFLRDREAKTTERVSLTVGGGEADGQNTALGVADGGTAVLFLSESTNLVPGDTNGLQDIFVRVALCGDGVVDRGEECDDGNLTGGDGCSATCLLDCPPTRRTDCLTPVQSGKATIKLADRTPSTKDQLQWKWIKGALTAKSAFGQPTSTAGYRLCVYDGGGLAVTVGIPPGAGWKESPTSFKYKSKSGLPDGVTTVMLKEGIVAGKAKIQIKGKGALLPMPALAMLASPLTVQLSNTLPVPVCWEAVYTGPFLRQDAAQLKAKAD